MDDREYVDDTQGRCDHPPHMDTVTGEAWCGRCGSSAAWHECDNCGGIGLSGHDCGEDCCVCADPRLNVVCDICLGLGGWWVCVADPDWCGANPAPGNASVRRGVVVFVAETDGG